MTPVGDDRVPVIDDVVRVLVVDDHPGFVRAVEPVITATPGFELVATAGSGAEALDLLAACHDIDLVLLDVNMPEMSGLEVARRYADARGGAKVILMSTSTLDELAVEATAAHVAGFIAKDELSTAELARVWSTASRSDCP